jgi:cell division protein FtsW
LSAESVKSSFIASLSFLPIKPHIANGAIRWIDFIFLPNFQPSEFTKIALLIYFSFVLWKNETAKITWETLKKPLYALGLSSILILMQPDLGTVVLIFGIILSSLWVCKVPLKIIVYLALTVTIVGGCLAFFVSYRADRITAFVDSSTDQAAQIRGVQQAITSGGFWGKGYGNGEFKQQPGKLFEQSTDAIIAIIGEEFGFVGTVTFLFFYIWLVKRGLQIARQSPDNGGKALATGVVFWIATQAFINVFGMLGLIPLKGIPLPFVSQGGSSIVINLLAIGVLLNVSKQKVV